jgi:hypothetical protein
MHRYRRHLHQDHSKTSPTGNGQLMAFEAAMPAKAM